MTMHDLQSTHASTNICKHQHVCNICRANHKSVLGVGALAREHGATIACVDEQGMESFLDSAKREMMRQGARGQGVACSRCCEVACMTPGHRGTAG